MTAKGFTMIEIIVIAILGILTVLVVSVSMDYAVRTRVTEGINLAFPAQ